MTFLRSLLFTQFKEIIFGFSLKEGLPAPPPFYFNLSLSIGDDPETVIKRRDEFSSAIGLSPEQIAYQKQVHGNSIQIIEIPGHHGESDAMITTKSDIGLAISTADCVPVFIFDCKQKIIAGVHSGWRSTQKKILSVVLEKLIKDFKCDVANLYVYVGPSISVDYFEVGVEVAELFDAKFLEPNGDKYLLDLPGINRDILSMYEIPNQNIQVSSLCSYRDSKLFHSYRRDGVESGRAFGIIGMRRL